MPKVKQFSKADVITWGEAHGWSLDRFGHLKKTCSNGHVTENLEFRIKLQKTSARFERKINGEWYNLRSTYYKHLGLAADGMLVGLGSVNAI